MKALKPIKALDWTICSIGTALAVLSGYYIENERARYVLTGLFSIIGLVFLILALRGKPRAYQTSEPEGGVSELILLSEEDSELARWELYGKTSMVIGRDIRNNHVDVNLNSVTYASMIDIEHAVLNYTAGSWYMEDLGSQNGVSVQKAVDGRKYRIAPDQPCRLEKGDVIYIGLTRLLIR